MMAGWIRVARPASRARHLVMTLLQTAAMWGGLLWLAPAWIVAWERQLGVRRFEPWTFAGWILLAVASALGLWSGWTMAWHGDGTPLPLDTARRFVVAGPYRWIRNPMAVAGLAQGVGVALVLGSFSVLAYCVAGGMLWQRVARPVEEADLAARFGAVYERYRREVPCWRPRFPGVIQE